MGLDTQRPGTTGPSPELISAVFGLGLFLLVSGVLMIAFRRVRARREFIPLDSEVSWIGGLLAIGLGAIVIGGAWMARKKPRA
jgi:hypothetical protein